MTDRQPAALLLLGDTDGLAADRGCNGGAEGVGGIHDLLDDGGVFQLLAKARLGVAPLNLVVGSQPSLESSAEFRGHCVKLTAPPTGSGRFPLTNDSEPDHAIDPQYCVMFPEVDDPLWFPAAGEHAYAQY